MVTLVDNLASLVCGQALIKEQKKNQLGLLECIVKPLLSLSLDHMHPF